MNELLAVALITVLAVISPGPDFAMVTRNSYAYGRQSGLIAALGIACGVQVHVFYTVFGIAVIITQSPLLFMGMKWLGAGYLIYLGVRSLLNTSKLALANVGGGAPSLCSAFRTGFFTNALNPKTMLFVVATYSQVVQAGSSIMTNFAYGLFMSFSHWVWFSIVALFFSSGPLRRRMLEKQHVVDRVIGTALIGLAACLVLPGLGS
ncbi:MULTISPECIES: LysE family translocator [unclassified Pseudomonas]|uniref:LysE family translocator n=1 Tax=unclassified Pseudomonas TaxID=196821 RepID=UPI001787529C|nr:MULTISPECIES: LysE family translocator [unclassified Pseudomonas]MBD8602405.1 LysE family translocator [Pseudomonas sp. CFBP 8771]MBD8622636.1 LysE family translocator [Pseudomonas sp. CFBP 13727]MBD8730555.1 LysE family translocator [Pseudomonas sp. CFBP 13710]MBD8828702.1 LysE family translocator [Pseudomonas sp. CFBP 13602]